MSINVKHLTLPFFLSIILIPNILSNIAYAKEVLRIEIKKEGVYYIYYQDIQKAGIPTGIDPRTIKIFNQGVEIPIYIYGEEDGHLGPYDYIEFYAEAILRESGNYEFTSTNIYWFEWGGVNGKRVIKKKETPEGLLSPPSFINRIHIEEDKEWWWEATDINDRDYWFWERLSGGEERVYTFNVNNIYRASNDCSVKVSVHGRTDVFISPDHHTRVYLNNNLLNAGEEEWDGMITRIWEIKGIPCNFLKEGENTFKIEASGVPITNSYVSDLLDADKDGLLDIDSIFVNWFEVEYRDTYTAEDNYLKFTGSGDGIIDFTLSNFGYDERHITIFDITEYPAVVYKFTDIKGSSGTGYEISFRDTLKNNQAREYVATVTYTGFPEKIEKYNVSTGLRDKTNQADYIIITHDSLYDSAEALADYRKGQGLKTMVIKVNNIYDEISYGLFTPKAIKDFLTYAYNYWSTRPKYVVLFGDANLDYKDNYHYEEPNMIPTYFISGEFGLIPSDNWFVDIKDDILPEMLIGRISVKNPTDARIVVDKIIKYETDPDAVWHKNLLFIADDDDYSFEDLADDLYINLPPDYTATAKKVYMGTYYDLLPDNRDEAEKKAREDIAEDINNGALITVYTGHGDIDQWADEHMIDSYYLIGNNFYGGILENYDKPSFVITLNCLNGFFPLPNEGGIKNNEDTWDIPLAEAFLRLDRRGAVAVWSPTSLGYTWQHSALAEHLFDALFKDEINIIGEITNRAKTLAYQNDGISDDIVHMYTLFGDPATRLRGVSGKGNPEITKGESTSSGSGGCFIATAAYGSSLHPHIRYLREFRDKFLVTNKIGRVFVNFYYEYSPPVAEYIAKRPYYRMVVRVYLIPLVAFAWLTTILLPLYEFVIAFFCMISIGLAIILRQIFTKTV